MTRTNRMMKLKRMECAGHVARMGEKGNAYWLLMGKPKEKRPLGRPRRRWVDNSKINLGGIGWEWSGSGASRGQL
jgi:hypothetical protein